MGAVETFSSKKCSAAVVGSNVDDCVPAGGLRDFPAVPRIRALIQGHHRDCTVAVPRVHPCKLILFSLLEAQSIEVRLGDYDAMPGSGFGPFLFSW
ncbi:uncharacterized protein LOC143864141 isoform X4 [Tasmannia lanceolata]|uniref:uncharacterized protein LOC143864141 isoform X4 n=1 Tax=Tasmannia lanceolata TaxID=3420 RepID=UPI004063A408